MADTRKLEPTKTPGVYKRGSRYVVRWKYRGRSEKRYFATYSEAREFKRSLAGAARQPTTRLTVADYYADWIDSYRGRTSRGLEDTTRASYRNSMDRHVLGFPLGRTKMRDVTSRDVSDWFGDLERSGVTAPSVGKAKAALSAMFATAAQAGDIPANPVIGVRYVPTVVQRKTKPRPLTVEDVAAILRAMPQSWRLFFELLAHTGLRFSEAAGLTWQHVHLGDDPHLAVVEQFYRGRRKRLKTDGSERTIPLSAGMARALTEWKAETEWAGPDSPVFASKAGTPVTYANVRRRVLHPALRQAGIAVRAGVDPKGRERWDYQGVAFHAFRKACGSMLLLRAGKDPRQVQQWLGHSKLTTTMDVYVHELDDGLGGADELDAILRGHLGATDGPQTAGSASDEMAPEPQG